MTISLETKSFGMIHFLLTYFSIGLFLCVCCVLSHFSRVQLFETLYTIACQAPLSKIFSRQKYWSGLPCPPPGDLTNQRIKLTSLMSPALAGGFFTISTTWEAPGLFPSSSQMYLLLFILPSVSFYLLNLASYANVRFLIQNRKIVKNKHIIR